MNRTVSHFVTKATSIHIIIDCKCHIKQLDSCSGYLVNTQLHFRELAK